MISKIGATPTFTSNVNIVYNNDYSVKQFYESDEMRHQIFDIRHNGQEDTVNLIPISAHYEKEPYLKVQVLKKGPYQDVFYGEAIAKEPEDLLSAYKLARKQLFAPGEVKSIRKEAREMMNYFV